MMHQRVIGNRVRIPGGRATVNGELHFRKPLDWVSGKEKMGTDP